MDWSIGIIVGGTVIAWLLLKRLALVSASTARHLLTQGALVIDVRSPQEFQRGNVPGAMNIPLNVLRQEIGRVAPDKQRPILVHCLSGGRSAIAQSQLKGLGYAQVLNLGSLSRAQQLQAESGPRRRNGLNSG